MNSFIDTNVSIAYTFLIDSLYNNAINVFKKYSLVFWSYFVQREFNKVFSSKKEILAKFYLKLLDDVIEGTLVKFSLEGLYGYAKGQDYIKKEYEQIKGSLSSFWHKYVGESFPSLYSLAQAILSCLIDLMVVSFKRKNHLKSHILLSEERTEEYSNLKNKLIMNGVHPEDACIVLDAHDHNLKTSYDLDFITFDKNCYDGTKRSNLPFHDIKYKWDFIF